MIPYNYAEEEVFAFIKQQCVGEEKIEFMPYDVLRSDQGVIVVPDMYLPKGCRRLGIEPKTCIEVKLNLHYDTLDRMRSMNDFIAANLPDEGIHLILVTMEPVEVRNVTKAPFMERNIEILYYGDLQARVKGQRNIAANIPNTYLPEELKSVRKAYLSGPNTFFLGAGVSRSEGLPDWNGLLIDLMRRITGRQMKDEDLDAILKANGNSTIILGRYIRSLIKGDTTIEQYVRRALYRNRHDMDIKSKTIMAICDAVLKNRNTVKSIITYNYDDLIEQQLSAIGIDAASIFDTHEPDNRFPVYHVHGILDQADFKSSKIVLSEDDYHEQYRRPFLWSNIEQLHALQNHNCFFIGLSMMDPNLRRLLDFTKSEANSRQQREHHCFAFMRKGDVSKYIHGDKKRFLEEQEAILENLGVRIVWYDNHDELPNILEQIYKM